MTSDCPSDPAVSVRSPGGGARAAELDALERRITSCRACERLVSWREQAAGDRRGGHVGEEYWARPLPGFGDPAARVVLVGLAPAAHGGNRTGRMFTGDRSGDFLFASLYRCGLANQPTSTSRDDGLQLRGAFVTAPVRCAPPENRPTTEERDRCAPFLAAELPLLERARVFVALGAYGYEALWREASIRPAGVARPRFAHGAEITLAPARDGASRWLLCSYHPSQRNVFTGLLRAEMLDAVLRRAIELAA